MRRAFAGLVAVAGIVVASAASSDARFCAPGSTRPCRGAYPEGTFGDASSFVGVETCVARGRGASYGACEPIRCAAGTTKTCTIASGAAGVAECQEPIDSSGNGEPLVFGACAAVRECRPYQKRDCPGLPQLAPGHVIQMTCAIEKDAWKFSRTPCDTPLVLSLDGRAVTFTRAPGSFRIGAAERTEWVEASTPWLAIDRDGDGAIDGESELFAGFEALAAFDDDRDGRITPRDAIFSELRVWRDRDQDRRSTPDELSTLADEGVRAIDLAYTSRPARAISYEGEIAPLALDGGRAGRVVDVHLAPMDP